MDSVIGTRGSGLGADQVAGVSDRSPAAALHPTARPTARATAEGELVAQIAAGDVEALVQLYDQYGSVVFGLLRHMLDTPEQAAEVTQDTFQAIARHAAAYRQEPGSVRHWLLATTRAAGIEWRRTKGRVEVAPTTDGSAEVVERRPVEARAATSGGAEHVSSELASLPAEQRLALSLAIWSGLSQREIAQRTDTPLDTVKTWVRLGMTQLRDGTFRPQ